MSQAPPPHQSQASPAFVAVLGVVSYLALLIAVWGVLSAVLDRDVVDLSGASPVLGPSMVAVACIVTWVTSWRAARRGQPLRGAVAAASISMIGMLGVALVGYSLEAVLHFAISPFIVTAALLSAVTVVATWAVVHSTMP